jgi:transposase-like protein
MEAIAREVGKSPSTVAYWVDKHGLVSAHAERHAARGPIAEEALRELVEQGLSVRQIAERLDRSPTAIRHWLRRHGLKTQPSDYAVRKENREAVIRECATHGWVVHVRDSAGYRRCSACRTERVLARRRRVKAQLVAEAGGACVLCGFDGYVGALQFHHVDPLEKRFEIGGRGLTRAIDSLREEAAKCVLLCANCHAAVEGGAANLPATSERHPGLPLRGSSTAEQSAVNR